MSNRIQRQTPLPNQESVWDYPRPPRVEPTTKTIRIVFNGLEIVKTNQTIRVLETSHPPSYYIPQSDILMQYFTPVAKNTFCEFKGQASYWTLKVEDKIAEACAWMYPNPMQNYEKILNHLAFYPFMMDACYVNDELVTPQEGGFYGGWITKDIVGPFKGALGTWGW
jgi:uncharacterized protein (DUF427 family)